MGIIRRLWLGFDLLACLAVAATVLYVAFVTAAREYAPTGQLFVFFAMIALGAAILLLTRYHVLSGLIFIALVVAIDRIDLVKFAATQTRLNASDWFVATNFVWDLDYSIVVQYRKQLNSLVWALGALALAAPILWACERAAIRKVRPWRPPAGIFAIAVILTCVSITALWHSRYLRGLGEFHPAEVQWARDGLRLSAIVLQFNQMSQIDTAMRSIQAEAKAAGLLPPAATSAATCGSADCPDIVVVHLESVFDPIMLADYRDAKGYLSLMGKQGSPSSKSGLLRVHTFGGASWLSEFAVLCGVDPQVFGLAGTLPHVNVSPYVKNCLPSYLKRLGYQTHAIYTSHWNFVGAGPGFKRYGIDDFIDIRRVKNAPSNWKAQRDKFFVAEARRILDEPSRHPRFIYVSTNWNHGPHGQGTHPETYQGPFDVEKTSDAATRDYVNRLNDTYTEMAAFERDLTARGKPTVILFYGDHHPAFDKKFAPDLAADPQVPPYLLTLYRFARSYGPAASAASNTLWIEELPSLLLEFAGVPLPPGMATIRSLREQCKKTDQSCPAPIKSAIAAAILED